MATAFSVAGIAGVLIAFAWFSVRETTNMSQLLRELGVTRFDNLLWA